MLVLVPEKRKGIGMANIKTRAAAYNRTAGFCFQTLPWLCW